jgi:5-methyltetrahydrofolate--homocysteine methyltransferase
MKGQEMLSDIKEAVLKGNRDVVVKNTKLALEQGLDIQKILDEGLIGGMLVMGEKFKNNEVFIPEVLISAKAMHAGLAILEPHLVKHGIKPVGKVVIGTVKGDLHDIGKNIVSMMLKGAGFEIHDLGIDVPKEKFLEALKRTNADILAMSSLLTTSMNSMKDIMKALQDAGLRDKVKTIVGGAPVTQDFADSIGADGYAKDAATAVDRAKELVRG